MREKVRVPAAPRDGALSVRERSGSFSAVREVAAYGAARAAEAVLAALPEAGARGAGNALGRLAHGALRIRRRLVEEQVAAAFPDRSRDWVRATARGCYLHFGREAVATFRMARMGRGAIRERVENAGEIESAIGGLTGDGGALVVTGHLGNWELAGSVLGGAGHPVTAVARPQRGRFDRRLARLRAALGVETLTMDEAPLGIPRALERGHLVALVADQHAGRRGVMVSFLGRQASTFRGPARLAGTLGVPLLFGALVRVGGGRGSYRAVVERVRAPEARNEAEREAELTRRWVARLERQVRERPEQYFWFHRRWRGGAAHRNGDPGAAVGE